MKKNAIFPFILWACVFTGNTFSQNTATPASPAGYSRYYFDLSAGFNFASMYGSEATQIETEDVIVPHFAGNAWLLFGYKPLKWISLESGASIVGKGLAYNEPVAGYNADLKRTHSEIFFEIPLILKPALSLRNRKTIYGIAGFSYGRKLSADYSVDVLYEDYDGSMQKENLYKSDLLEDGISFPIDTMGGKIVAPYKDGYRLDDVTFIGGIGLELGIGSLTPSSAVAFELKYCIGMRNQLSISPHGLQLAHEAAEKLTQFMIDNHLTAEDIGLENDGEYFENPTLRYNTFLVSIGFRQYF